MENPVRHEEARQRFVVDVPGGEAVVEYTRPDARTLDLRHTFVPPSGRGQGLAGKLVRAALDYARGEHLRVIPTCPYVPGFLERNPEYADLVERR